MAALFPPNGAAIFSPGSWIPLVHDAELARVNLKGR
jgi:hypothetical protein